MKTHSALLAAALVLLPAGLGAQAGPHISIADRDRAAGNVAASHQHLEMAITAEPSNYEALWKASRDAVDLGEHDASADRRTTLYRAAEGYARRAVSANPTGAEGHFAVARALGRTALGLGSRDRVKYASEVRHHALEALKANPNHAGALHVMGLWNAEVMRLSGVQRFAARTLLGGKVFGEASWREARRYLEAAVAAEPNRITHRLALGEIYADMKESARAKEQFAAVARMAATELNDGKYKQQAATRNGKL